MALLPADRVYLHDAEDLSSFERFVSGRPDDTDVVRGEVSQAANGRLRTVSLVGERQTIAVMVREVSPAQLVWLKARKGALLMYRDPARRLLFGSFFGLSIVEYRTDPGFDVSFTFEQVTRTVEV